jgi:hypothetical protein
MRADTRRGLVLMHAYRQGEAEFSARCALERSAAPGACLPLTLAPLDRRVCARSCRLFALGATEPLISRSSLLVVSNGPSVRTSHLLQWLRLCHAPPRLRMAILSRINIGYLCGATAHTVHALSTALECTRAQRGVCTSVQVRRAPRHRCKRAHLVTLSAAHAHQPLAVGSTHPRSSPHHATNRVPSAAPQTGGRSTARSTRPSTRRQPPPCSGETWPLPSAPVPPTSGETRREIERPYPTLLASRRTRILAS